MVYSGDNRPPKGSRPYLRAFCTFPGGLRLRPAADEAAEPLNQPVGIRRGVQGAQDGRQRRALLNPVAQLGAQPCIRGSEVLRRNVERRGDSLLELGAGRTAASLQVSDIGGR